MSKYELAATIMAAVAIIVSIIVPLITGILNSKKSKKANKELNDHGYKSKEDLIASMADVRKMNGEIAEEQKNISTKQAEAIFGIYQMFSKTLPVIAEDARMRVVKGQQFVDTSEVDKFEEYKEYKKGKTDKKNLTEWNKLRKEKTNYAKIINEVHKRNINDKHKKSRKGVD